LEVPNAIKLTMMKIFGVSVVLLLTFLLCRSEADYLKDIRVVYTEDKMSKPADSIQGTSGLNTDINSGFGGEFVWFVPVWTSSLSEEASSTEVVVQKEPNKALDAK